MARTGFVSLYVLVLARDSNTQVFTLSRSHSTRPFLPTFKNSPLRVL
jgi:hypothetical protein